MSRVIEYDSIFNAPTYKNTEKSIETAKIQLPFPYKKSTGVKEADILTGIIDVLKLKKCWYKRIQVQGAIRHTASGSFMTPSSMTGMPDVIALVDGLFVGIEAKRPGGTITRQQLNTLQDINKHGGLGLIVINYKMLFDDTVTAELEGVKVL